jgi:hypothetical protein
VPPVGRGARFPPPHPLWLALSLWLQYLVRPPLNSILSSFPRITKLLEDEVEQDEVFWNQDALKEDEEDDNYEEEQDAGDEFDSDFGEDVSEIPLHAAPNHFSFHRCAALLLLLTKHCT